MANKIRRSFSKHKFYFPEESEPAEEPASAPRPGKHKLENTAQGEPPLKKKKKKNKNKNPEDEEGMASTADESTASTADESTASTAHESTASTADEDSVLEEGEAAEASSPVKEKKLKKKKKKADLESATSGTILNSFCYQCFCSVLIRRGCQTLIRVWIQTTGSSVVNPDP